MNSTLSKETNVILQKGELERLLEAAAKAINLPDMYSTRTPQLKINYVRNLPDIPEGAWVHGQRIDDKGNVIDPGVRVDNPEIAILAVRIQYAFYSSAAKRYHRSPMFKQFGELARVYKQTLVNEVNEQALETITENDVRADQLVYALVYINKEWKPCAIPNFHGSNYAVLNNYLKGFDKIPYCAFSTHLPNATAVRSGATTYYKIESITRGEKMFDAEFLKKLIADARDLNMALDTNAMGSEEQSSDQASQISSRQAGELPPADDGARNGDGINGEEVPF